MRAHAQPSGAAQKRIDWMPGETVLVIDDSPTILKVVQLVLTKAGFQITTAPDGEAGVATARGAKPDMILLDFVMPKMNGYQVCRALANENGLKDIPVVLMSAKGDQVGERFVKVMGIVDYITKPFSPEAITAVVQHTISKYAKGGAQGASPPLVLGANEVEAGSPTAREGAEKQQHLSEVRDTLAKTLAPRVAEHLSLLFAAKPDADDEDAPPSPEEDAIREAVRTALDDQTLCHVLGRAQGNGLDTNGDEPVLQGDLRVVPLAEVLQLLQVQSQSGILQAARAKGKVDVFFRQGKIDLCAAHDVSEEFLLGRFILDNQLMSKQDFETFLKSRPPTAKLLGSQLVKHGYISESELKQAIAKQTCELIYEVLRWSFGRFTFRATRDLPPIAVDASLGLDVDGILMEGFRRVDEWHLIEREIDNFDIVFLRNEDAVAQMGRGRLTREELAVLELVNGKNTVKEIVRQTRMGSFDVSKMLYRLLSIKLIRRRVMPVAV
jgi:DNA-binding response OmpR family regulator